MLVCLSVYNCCIYLKNCQFPVITIGELDGCDVVVAWYINYLPCVCGKCAVHPNDRSDCFVLVEWPVFGVDTSEAIGGAYVPKKGEIGFLY